MDVRSIKQIAEEQNVSYEAIRKQIVRYADDLKGHIIRKNRTQYLDEWAVDFLKEKRKENPIILMNLDQHEQIDELKAQVESLQARLMAAQDEMLKFQNRIIELQEDKVKYTALLEDSKAKEEQIDKLTKERDEARTEAQSFTKSLFGFYRKK